MADHWYEYLPAAWFIPEVRWYVLLSVVLLMAIAFVCGVWVGRRMKNNKTRQQHG